MLLQPKKHVLKAFFVHSRPLGIVELQKEKDTKEEQCQRRQMVCLKLRRVSKKQCCKVRVVSEGPFLLSQREAHIF